MFQWTHPFTALEQKQLKLKQQCIKLLANFN